MIYLPLHIEFDYRNWWHNMMYEPSTARWYRTSGPSNIFFITETSKITDCHEGVTTPEKTFKRLTRWLKKESGFDVPERLYASYCKIYGVVFDDKRIIPCVKTLCRHPMCGWTLPIEDSMRITSNQIQKQMDGCFFIPGKNATVTYGVMEYQRYDACTAYYSLNKRNGNPNWEGWWDWKDSDHNKLTRVEVRFWWQRRIGVAHTCYEACWPASEDQKPKASMTTIFYPVDGEFNAQTMGAAPVPEKLRHSPPEKVFEWVIDNIL